MPISPPAFAHPASPLYRDITSSALLTSSRHLSQMSSVPSAAGANSLIQGSNSGSPNSPSFSTIPARSFRISDSCALPLPLYGKRCLLRLEIMTRTVVSLAIVVHADDTAHPGLWPDTDDHLDCSQSKLDLTPEGSRHITYRKENVVHRLANLNLIYEAAWSFRGEVNLKSGIPILRKGRLPCP